jgi:hypothetical protein
MQIYHKSGYHQIRIGLDMNGKLCSRCNILHCMHVEIFVLELDVLSSSICLDSFSICSKIPLLNAIYFFFNLFQLWLKYDSVSWKLTCHMILFWHSTSCFCIEQWSLHNNCAYHVHTCRHMRWNSCGGTHTTVDTWDGTHGVEPMKNGFHPMCLHSLSCGF